ncbi:GNAT family N-acetyltransferase [Streptomyces sp. G-G2]|uniref:GNAT family N-acetyltransferase n=1 Tax=Streptomyces sp. G-G2 TaxID=3046201 RepID=UPI0024B9C58D|nr:GNAT family N-acetyltransferase [Streptomyces sp. G-G2]MDJ0379506.1 GNAT family N-acetyltransferase [Streptomyces sp. G-G2]
MDLDAVRALFDAEARRGAQSEGDQSVVERAGAVVRRVSRGGGWNGVLHSDLDESTADAQIAAQIAYFDGLGVSEFEWKMYDYDAPADLGERLLAAGFVPEPPETLMVARVADIVGEVRAPEGVTLVNVTDVEGVDLMMDVHAQAFGQDRPRIRHALVTQVTRAPETILAVVAMAGGQPVSSARMEITPGASFAGLWGGGTVPEWRGKGIYRALVTHRALAAAELGIPYLQVDASSESRPILERLGFGVLGVTVPYVWVGK